MFFKRFFWLCFWLFCLLVSGAYTGTSYEDAGPDFIEGLLAGNHLLRVDIMGDGGQVTSNPPGIDCGGVRSSCIAIFEDGTWVTLTVHLEQGYTFAGWGLDCASCGKSLQCRVKMEEEKVCTAVFRPIPSLVDLKVNGSDGPLSLSATDQLAVTISVNPEGLSGKGDFFLVARVPGGACYCYRYPGEWFSCSCTAPQPAYQGDLLYLSDFLVFRESCAGLPVGSYTLFFAVDAAANGLLDPAYALDRVEFEILP